MPKVTEAHLEARRQQILDAAWACFARKGYHQTTMQDICQESELSPGAIYRYFAGKEAILEAINDRSQEMGRALVEEARARAGGPLDTLQVIGQTMLSAFADPMFETTTRVNIEICRPAARPAQGARLLARGRRPASGRGERGRAAEAGGGPERSGRSPHVRLGGVAPLQPGRPQRLQARAAR
jgi:AcrR family transcriptional regulator